MDEELYIPPCCIDQKLPHVIQSGSCVYFYSRGDWGLQQLWAAVSQLVSGSALCVLVVHTVDVHTLRFLKTYFDRGWMGALVLITSTDDTAIVKSELSAYLGNLWYCPNAEDASRNQLWIRSSNLTTMVISGPITIAERFAETAMCSYTSSLSTSDITAKRAFLPWKSICHIHAKIKGKSSLFEGWV